MSSSVSLSSSQFRSPYADLLPPGLLVAIQYHPGRWHQWTLFAAMAIPNCEEMSPRDWTLVLDRIEAQLSVVIPPVLPI